MSELKLVTGEPAELLLDLGKHPIAHKFVRQQQVQETGYPIKLGLGKRSGLVGLIDPPKWQSLTPIYSWIKCNEPEDHLDELAIEISSMLKPEPSILGLSDKDVTLLQRLARLGHTSSELFQHPMLTQSLCPGVEVVQAAISEGMNNTQLHDLIIGRHILEHTQETEAFLRNMISMLADDGLAVIEVPDNERAFSEGQHTIIWEEHSLYFTEVTLKNLLAEYGLCVAKFIRYPMALEDILVVILKKQSTLVESTRSGYVIDEEGRDNVIGFKTQFEQSKFIIREKLQGYKQRHGGVAILGAGHLGAAFINYYKVADLIDAVIDDDPNKQGLLMPGSLLPIIGSESLNDGTYSLCLLTCNPWNNEKIAAKNQGFVDNHGVFLSVFQLESWL